MACCGASRRARSAPVDRTFNPDGREPLQVTRSRASFWSDPPATNTDPEVVSIRFGTLRQARDYAAAHPGWTSEMRRVPVDS